MLRQYGMTLVFGLAMVLPAQPVSGQETALRKRIDAEVEAAWKREKVTQVESADDAAFMRRIYLDLVGTIPTHDEAKAFLHDTDPARRTKLIDKLLDDPRYAVQQAQVWDMVLFGRTPGNPSDTRLRPGFQKWLRNSFAKNVPYDQWVRELLLAEGNSLEQGAPLFYVQYRAQPEETMVAVSRIFLGTQLQCAQCHDHPYENWTQRDFFGMAAFFGRLVMLDGGNKKFTIAEKRTGEVLFTGPAIEQKPGQKGTPVGAKFLGGAELVESPVPKDYKEPPKGAKTLPKPDFSRKEKLAQWLTSPDNPYFTRAIVNRLWSQFLRRGLVHPVDNLTAGNKASHPELLALLEKQLKEHQYDLKWLIREIVNSKTYQLASRGPAEQPAWFGQLRLRPLSAEEIIASLQVALGQDKSPPGLDENLVRLLGSPTDGRGDFQGSLTERLFVSNNVGLRAMIRSGKGNLAEKILASKETPEQKVDRLYLSILSRPPSAEERARFVAHLTSAAAQDVLVEEAIWALVASAEFRFCH